MRGREGMRDGEEGREGEETRDYMGAVWFFRPESKFTAPSCVEQIYGTVLLLSVPGPVKGCGNASQIFPLSHNPSY